MSLLKQGDLSVVPTLISSNILLSAFFSMIVLHESYSYKDILGLAFATFGIMLLTYDQYKIGNLRVILYSLFVAALYSLSSVFDKLAIINSSPIFYALCISVTLSLIYFFLIRYMIKNHENDIKFDLFYFVRDKYAFLLGISTALVIILQTYSLSIMNTAYVLLLKRLSILINVFLGWKYFAEKNIVFKFLSVIFVFTGIVLIVT